MVAALLTIASMGILTYKGAVAKEPLAAENLLSVPGWAKQQGFPPEGDAVEGAKIFAQVGCMNCHTYLGKGTSNLSAPDLSEIGRTSNRGVEGYATYVADPAQFGNNVMPKFGGPDGLGDENLRLLGVFLQSSGTCKPKTDACPSPSAGGQ
jgi:cytochrome c553